MRHIFYFLIVLFAHSAIAQNGFVSKQARITRSYEQLTAAYSVVTDDNAESVYCKFNNQGTQSIAVILSITNADQSTSHKQVEVLAGSLASINIGDIKSVSVSITELKPGEDSQDKSISGRADLRDHISKEGGKLSAIAYDKTAQKKNTSPKKEEPSSQTKKIIEIIFGKNSTTGMTFNEEDTKMANYFLKELVNGSCGMSLAKVLFETTYTFDPDIKDIVLDLIEAYGENCGKGAKKGEYYKTIVETIRAKYHTAFENRKQNGEWLMTMK